MGWPLLAAESVCPNLLGFGIVDGSLMAVQNLGPTGIARLIRLISRTFVESFTLDVTRTSWYFCVVIVSYRDKRTREFAAGKRVKAFSGFERSARLKLDRMEAATSLRDLSALPGNRFEALVGDRKGQ